MRKIALLPLFFCLVGFQSAEAQVRDLFSEFEEEAAADSKPAAKAAQTPAVKAEAKTETKAAPAKVETKAEVKPAPASKVETKKAKPVATVAPTSSSFEVKVVVSSSSEVKVVVSSSSEMVVSSSSADAVASVEPAAVESSSSVTADSTVELPVYTPEQEAANAQKRAAMEYAAQVQARVDSARHADSLAQAKAAGLMDLSSSSAKSSSSINRRDLLGPVKVSKVHSIDEMKGRYKNPRKALFMSLVVPGSGQLYVGGSDFTYVRGGVYLALEAALWINWGYFSVHKYNQQVDRYKKFAKEHYSIGRYEKAMRELFNTDADLYASTFASRYLSTRKSFCEALYGEAGRGDGGCYHENVENLFKNDEGYKHDYVPKKNVSIGEALDDGRSFSSASEVYQLIADGSYVLGWDDVENATLASDLKLAEANAETVSLGESSAMKEYRSMRSKATDYADMQAWFFGGLILNHIISAIDAAFTANAHNKTLYQEDLSWYDRLHFDSGVSFVDGFNMNVRASWGF